MQVFALFSKKRFCQLFAGMVLIATPSESLFAKIKTAQIDRASRWVLIGKSKNKNGDESFALQRFVRLVNMPLPVTTIHQSTTTRAKHQTLSAEQSYQEALSIVEFFRKSVDAPKWEISRDDKARTYTFRADWPKLNRYVQVLYKDLGDKYLVSTAFTKRLFIFPVALEAKYIQQQLANRSVRQVGWLENFIDSFKLPEAFATTGSTVTGTIGGYSLNLSTTGLDSTVSDVSNRIDNSVRGNIDYGYERARSLKNETITDLDELRRRTARDANKLYEKATSFSNVATTAFTAAFAGAAGVAAFKILEVAIVDGLVPGISALYHDIVGTMSEADKDLMRRAAGDSFNQLENASKRLNDIEIQMHRRIAALSAVAGMDPETLTESVSQAIIRSEDNLSQLQTKLRDEKNPTKRDECVADISAARKRHRMLSSVHEILVGDENSVQGVCAQLQSLFNQWSKEESALHNAQSIIAETSDAILDNVVKSFVEAHEERGTSRAKLNLCKENIEKAKDMGSKVKATRACVVQQYNYNRYIEGSGRTDFEDEVKRYCEKQSFERYSRTMQAMNDACDLNSQQAAKIDRSAQIQNGAILAAANLQAAQNFLDRIRRMDCQQSVPTDLCDGRAGSFQQIRNRYNALFQSAQQKCPELREPTILKDAEIYRGPAEPDAPRLAAPGTPSTGQPTPNKKEGWVERQFSAIGSFFSSLFSWV